jgi:NADH-quinone oxidoreductase subunit J
MQAAFYIAAAVAIAATILMLTRLNTIHALLYLVVSLLSVSVVFYTLGAPFIAALEVIIYAGAIMVLFVFVVMMLGPQAAAENRSWLTGGMWIGPSILAAILIGEAAWLVTHAAPQAANRMVTPKELGIALYGPYVLGVELASLLLLGGLVGAYHLGRRNPVRKEMKNDTHRALVNAGDDLVRAGSGRTAGQA